MPSDSSPRFHPKLPQSLLHVTARVILLRTFQWLCVSEQKPVPLQWPLGPYRSDSHLLLRHPPGLLCSSHTGFQLFPTPRFLHWLFSQIFFCQVSVHLIFSLPSGLCSKPFHGNPKTSIPQTVFHTSLSCFPDTCYYPHTTYFIY